MPDPVTLFWISFDANENFLFVFQSLELKLYSVFEKSRVSVVCNIYGKCKFTFEYFRNVT